MKEIPQQVSESVRKRNPHLYGNSVDAMVARSKAGLPMLQIDDKPAKRIRQSSKPVLNKLEQEFQAYHEASTGHKLIPQSIRFKLGNGIWFKPDFFQWFSTMGPTAFEVKGPHSFRGGFENLKVAASLYRNIEWVLVWKEGGTWRKQIVLP